MEGPLYEVCKKKQKYSTSVDLKLQQRILNKTGYCHIYVKSNELQRTL